MWRGRGHRRIGCHVNTEVALVDEKNQANCGLEDEQDPFDDHDQKKKRKKKKS